VLIGGFPMKLLLAVVSWLMMLRVTASFAPRHLSKGKSNPIVNCHG
jgi:hypothetical protein